jgi:hypothetical protein
VKKKEKKIEKKKKLKKKTGKTKKWKKNSNSKKLKAPLSKIAIQDALPTTRSSLPSNSAESRIAKSKSAMHKNWLGYISKNTLYHHLAPPCVVLIFRFSAAIESPGFKPQRRSLPSSSVVKW